LYLSIRFVTLTERSNVVVHHVALKGSSIQLKQKEKKLRLVSFVFVKSNLSERKWHGKKTKETLNCFLYFHIIHSALIDFLLKSQLINITKRRTRICSI